MRSSHLAIPFTAALVSAAHYKRTPHKIKEDIGQPPDDWLRHDSAPSDHLLELNIALPQPHFHILEKHLYEISDPDHERYGAYLSKEETNALMAPHPETLDVVSEWLSSHGIEEEHLYRSSAQDLVTIRVPVSLVEEMLNTKYDIYTHSNSGENIVRTTSYSLPESLHEHIELIQPTTMFMVPRPFKSTLHWSSTVLARSLSSSIDTITGPAGNEVDASCNRAITIKRLRQLYNAVKFATSSTNGNKIAVTAFIDQYANNQDLQQFFQLQNPAAYGSNYTFVSINGGLNNQTCEAAGSEANMNTQFAFGLTYPTPAILYSIGGSLPYLPWLNHMLDQEKYFSHGRGIPDVAAQAMNFIQGTSCSTPTFAAFVSILNDGRIRARKRPLGFLNPWLYKKGYAGLNDITVGNNPGCSTQGFNATVGWDPVTGLGTPKELLRLATV